MKIITTQDAINAVCNTFDVKEAELLSSETKNHNIKLRRQMLIYLLREKLKHGLQEIGDLLNMTSSGVHVALGLYYSKLADENSRAALEFRTLMQILED